MYADNPDKFPASAAKNSVSVAEIEKNESPDAVPTPEAEAVAATTAAREEGPDAERAAEGERDGAGVDPGAVPTTEAANEETAGASPAPVEK